MTNVKVSRGKKLSKEAKVGDILISPDNKLSILTKDKDGYYRLLFINTVGIEGEQEAGTYTTCYASIAGIRDIITIRGFKVVEDMEILIKE